MQTSPESFKAYQPENQNSARLCLDKDGEIWSPVSAVVDSVHQICYNANWFSSETGSQFIAFINTR